MSLNLYSNCKRRTREQSLQSALACPVSFPRPRKSSSIMRALAMLGLGIEGVAAGEDEHIHGTG
ncbi:MAG: hypothetical protein WBX11_03190 [Thiobacillaceae bacterium]